MSNRARILKLERAYTKLLTVFKCIFIDCPEALTPEQLEDENTIYLYLEI